MWIEIVKGWKGVLKKLVTPFAGVWIEIDYDGVSGDSSGVTPFAGVWIEISVTRFIPVYLIASLPSRECGLK